MICEPTVHGDDRGYFVETFRADKLEEFLGYKINFCQDNESKSSRGVLRGLHYQTGEYAQAKLVRVAKGSVLDVVVDLRPTSSTFMNRYGIILNDINKFQLFVPRGFAHGFLTLSKKAIFTYKCDNYYNRGAENGIHPLNNTFDIPWGIDKRNIILSEKDDQQNGCFGKFNK